MKYSRLRALIIKEVFQIFRDPSTMIITFIFPIILIIIYTYAVSLDINHLRIGVVLEDDSTLVRDFVGAFENNRFLNAEVDRTRDRFEKELMSTKIRGFVVIPVNFTKSVEKGNPVPIQVIADGSEPNTAKYVANYTLGVWTQWSAQKNIMRGVDPLPQVSVLSRVWYNPQLESRDFLLPGALALIMTLTGALLTALVISREWERGTMEALLTTSVTRTELLLGKFIPYFILGMLSLIISSSVIILVFHVPFRGSLLVLFGVGAVFMCTALGLGLLISTTAKNQFVACQLAFLLAFMPSMMLSGFIFEINSMPKWVQAICYLVPAKYLISCLNSLFLVGDIWEILIPNVIFMAVVSVLLFAATYLKTQKSLD